ncbi:MAG: RNA polymerase sigma factor [Planctomycetes bacterium]|nr:RNA polymerase sigma factor [Planctomycetota bacterium]
MRRRSGNRIFEGRSRCGYHPDMSDGQPEPKAGMPREEAIPVLLEQEGGRLFGLGRRLCGGDDAAEDLVQEVFLQAYKDWSGFEGRSSPRTWLYAIAARACQRLQKRRAGEPEQMAPLEEALPFLAATMVDVAALEEDHDALERREAVEAAIALLPEDFRLPLVLKEVVGLPVAEVAAILGLKEATVKTRLHRARLRIRQSLEKVLPQRPSTPVAYDRQVCLDLLQAKQEALDREVDFPLDEVVCERCRSLFSTLDLTGVVCRDLGRDLLPRDLRARLLARLA